MVIRDTIVERTELKLKQASAVLGVPPKDLQNLVQHGVIRPRRRAGAYYFDRNTLLQAKVVTYLKRIAGRVERISPKFHQGNGEAAKFRVGAACDRTVDGEVLSG